MYTQKNFNFILLLLTKLGQFFVHSALSHTAQDVIPRCVRQHWMSSRAISHNAGLPVHPALSHTAQDGTLMFQISFRVVAHCAECNPPLCATAMDVIPRYLTQCRIISRVVAHSAGWNPTVSDFIPRCRTQCRMSLRAIAHSAGCHPALSHITQDFIPRCRTQRRICFDLFSKLFPCDSLVKLFAPMGQPAGVAEATNDHSCRNLTALVSECTFVFFWLNKSIKFSYHLGTVPTCRVFKCSLIGFLALIENPHILEVGTVYVRPCSMSVGIVNVFFLPFHVYSIIL